MGIMDGAYRIDASDSREVVGGEVLVKGAVVQSRTHRTRPRRRRTHAPLSASTAVCAILATTLPTSMAQNCISLANSDACSAFSAASISTNTNLTGLFPFLSSVTDTASFDSELRNYINNDFAQVKYQQLLGCSNFQPDNTTDFYARYTASVLCNAIIQNSIQPCALSGQATRPLCAESCAAYAESEQEITASNICGSAGNNALTQIRADFTNCALPSNALTGNCIQAVQNQPDNCGFTSNLGGLCGYCASSSPNNTDSCCVFSNTTSRCENVALPIVATSSLKPITMTMTTTTSGTSTAGAGGANGGMSRGLTGGQIAGIVVGSVLGALLLLALIIGGCILFKRRRERSPATSIFNQPSTSRPAPQMAFNDGPRDSDRGGLSMLSGGRVARMAALEESSSPERGAKYTPGGRKSIDDEDSPESGYAAVLAPPPKRSGSLSSGSQLAAAVARGQVAQDSSPSTNDDYTSPESHGQSEQLNFFKDYYSQDEIHAGDAVATLWAYEPRAADEFHLERGDMIKVLGIWDDGWATGVRIRQNAEDWRPEDKMQRDSGMSNGSSRPPDTADEGEVKAFPLVCVCLPQHWRKTIDGETTEGSDAMRYPDLP